MEYGILGLVILILDLFAIVGIVNSTISTGAKVAWVLAVLLLPLIGMALWFFIGANNRATV